MWWVKTDGLKQNSMVYLNWFAGIVGRSQRPLTDTIVSLENDFI